MAVWPQIGRLWLHAESPSSCIIRGQVVCEVNHGPCTANHPGSTRSHAPLQPVTRASTRPFQACRCRCIRGWCWLRNTQGTGHCPLPRRRSVAMSPSARLARMSVERGARQHTGGRPVLSPLIPLCFPHRSRLFTPLTHSPFSRQSPARCRFVAAPLRFLLSRQ